MESNIEETMAFYRFPQAHHKHIKSTNMLERMNEEFKRRTHTVRIFTDEACCLRLIRELAVEMHEEWIDVNQYPEHGTAAGNVKETPTRNEGGMNFLKS